MAEGLIHVVCVLRSGGVYKPLHVERLRKQVVEHLRIPHTFTCMTDISGSVLAACRPDISVTSLPRNWPNWWSKLCLFQQNRLPLPALYFDLDTTIIRSIDDIAKAAISREFIMLHGMTKPQWPGSGMMSWSKDMPHIFEAFDKSPNKFMAEFIKPEKWGDQGFINLNRGAVPLSYWQDVLPGQVVSYKLDCRDYGRRAPSNARVVCYHGKPKPWDEPVKV